MAPLHRPHWRGGLCRLLEIEAQPVPQRNQTTLVPCKQPLSFRRPFNLFLFIFCRPKKNTRSDEFGTCGGTCCTCSARPAWCAIDRARHKCRECHVKIALTQNTAHDCCFSLACLKNLVVIHCAGSFNCADGSRMLSMYISSGCINGRSRLSLNESRSCAASIGRKI